MKVDAQTLRELELFIAPEGGSSLFEHFKRTLTQGGERRLRQRFEHPLSGLDEILRVQETLCFLADSAESWQPALSGRQEQLIEAYFLSGIEPVSSGWGPALLAQGLIQTLVHRNFAPIEQGCLETWRALKDLHGFWRSRRGHEMPALLAAIWDELGSCFAAEQLAPLWRPRGGLGFGEIFRFDRLMREVCLKEVRRLLQLCFELDALNAMARLCSEAGWSFPVFEAGKPQLEIEGLRHPRLGKAVANNLRLAPERHFMLITGPNMGGKTTLLKACALAVYLAHLGLAVPARRMRLSPFAGLLTSLQNQDNLELGYSYFYSEVRRVRQAAELVHSHGQVLLLFDELFRGTNLQDAFEASLAIIERLSRRREVLCLLSTHLVELVPRIEALPGLQFACFKASHGPKGFSFDYQLHPGVSEHRIGLEILKREGVLELLDSA